MNLWTFDSESLPYWSVSFTLWDVSHPIWGWEGNRWSQGAAPISNNLYRVSDPFIWKLILLWSVKLPHDTLSLSPLHSIRNRKRKACFVTTFAFVNLTSDIEQSSQDGTQKNDQPLVLPWNGIRFSFLFLTEWRHSIYTMLGRNEKEVTLKTSSFI